MSQGPASAGSRSSGLVLASGSPRRRELLKFLDLEFDVQAAEIDEAVHLGESPTSYVERMAREKALARPLPDAVVLSADTSVVVDNEVFGKPGNDRSLAAEMLRRLSGRAHQVLTGVAVVAGGRTRTRLVTSEVRFRALSDREIDWYVSTGEGTDKAGGYAIQGRASAFITQIIGSPTNIIGLPLTETVELLRESGFPLPMDASEKR